MAKAIQGSFLNGQPKLSPHIPPKPALPPRQTRTASRPPVRPHQDSLAERNRWHHPISPAAWRGHPVPALQSYFSRHR